jgi:hypothetical protein
MKRDISDLPHLSRSFIVSSSVSAFLMVAGAFISVHFGGSGMLGVLVALIILAVTHLVLLLTLNSKCHSLYADAGSNTSYKYFYRMSSNFHTAYIMLIYCLLIALLLQYRFDPLKSILAIAAYSIFTTGIVVLFYVLFVRKLKADYDDPTLFAFGVFLWTADALLSYYHVLKWEWLIFAIFCFAFSIMVAILNNLRANMQTLLGFIADKDPKVMDTFDNRSVALSQTISAAVMILLVAFYPGSIPKEVADLANGLASSSPSGFTLSPSSFTVSTAFFINSMLLAPLVFLLIAFFAALLEPMDDIFATRVQRFAITSQHISRTPGTAGSLRSKLADSLKYFSKEDIQRMKSALQQYLMRETKHFWVRFIAFMVRPFFRCKVENAVVVDESAGPVVFVSNHMEIAGPIMCVLHLPFFFRPWIINAMLEPEKVEAQLRPGVEKTFRFLPKFWRKHIPSHLKNIVIYVMNSMHPIPVYRNGVREVIDTFNRTVEALEQGDNILLFPEKGDTYASIGVSSLYTGFAQIGSLYFEATGKRIKFYPIYISRRNQVMRIGDCVTYDSTNSKAEEKQRIAESLFSTMSSMASALDPAD